MRISIKSIAVAATTVPLLAFAGDVDSLDALARTTALAINPQLQDGALRTLVAATILQTIFSSAKSLFDSQNAITDTIRKLVFSLTWMLVLTQVIKSPEIFINFIDAALAKAAQVSGVADFSLKTIFVDAVASANKVNTIYDAISSKLTEDTGITDSIVAGITMLIYEFASLLFLAISYLVVIVFVFITKMEMYILVAIVPIVLSMGGLQAFREQALAPAKSMIGAFIRLVILGASIGFIKAGVDIFFTWAESMQALPKVPRGFYVTSLMFSIFPALGAAMALLNGKIAGAVIGGGMAMGGEAAMSSAANSMGSASDSMKKAASAMSAGAAALGQKMTGGGGSGDSKSGSPADALKNFSRSGDSGKLNLGSGGGGGNGGSDKTSGSGSGVSRAEGAVGDLGDNMQDALSSKESGSLIGNQFRSLGDTLDNYQAPTGQSVSMNLHSD